MALLDPRRGYILNSGNEGHGDGEGQGATATSEKPPRVLHIKLSPSVLEEIVSCQKANGNVELKSLGGSEPVSRCYDGRLAVTLSDTNLS
jgi:hypothetical protein